MLPVTTEAASSKHQCVVEGKVMKWLAYNRGLIHARRGDRMRKCPDRMPDGPSIPQPISWRG
eukprot:463934-Pyramimonas_sp.AAC.1